MKLQLENHIHNAPQLARKALLLQWPWGENIRRHRCLVFLQCEHPTACSTVWTPNRLLYSVNTQPLALQCEHPTACSTVWTPNRLLYSVNTQPLALQCEHPTACSTVWTPNRLLYSVNTQPLALQCEHPTACSTGKGEETAVGEVEGTEGGKERQWWKG